MDDATAREADYPTDELAAEVVANDTQGDEASDQIAESDEVDDPGRPARIAAWLLLVGGLALAGFVAIPAHTYDLELTGRVTSDVRDVDLIELWRIQARNLPEVRFKGLFQALFLVCGVIVLLGSAALIWLATVEITPPVRRPSDPTARAPAESPSPS